MRRVYDVYAPNVGVRSWRDHTRRYPQYPQEGPGNTGPPASAPALRWWPCVFADGRAFSIEGSVYLCGNGSGREPFALFYDPYLTARHTAWNDKLIGRDEGQPA
jgi:hypothetical protein